MIITEYGLSVSPTGPGGWGYGGNSLSEQESGDVYMYKSLVDGGANGACIFNYSDGWWKADDEFVHSDLPEEWFGLIEYSSLSDKQGHDARFGKLYGISSPQSLHSRDQRKYI